MPTTSINQDEYIEQRNQLINLTERGMPPVEMGVKIRRGEIFLCPLAAVLLLRPMAVINTPTMLPQVM